MSEDFKQSPGEPENTGSQPEPPSQESEAPQPEQQEQPAAPQYPPAPELYAQPAAEEPTSPPQYPPAPEEYYVQPQQTPIDPYGVPPAYSPPAPSYTPLPMGHPVPPVPERPTYGYGYSPQPPAQPPLPLGQAIRDLPQQYKRILFRPGAHSFAEEQGKADWGIIWIQLLFIVLFQIIITLPVSLMESSIFSLLRTPGVTDTPGMPVLSPAALALQATIGTIFLTPLTFFAGVGIQYLLARAFKGTGSFKTQAYNQLLYQVPTTFIIALLYLIITPFLNGLVSLTAQASNFNPLSFIVIMIVGLLASGVGIYSIVLNVFSIMAAHRLSGGRATGVVLIPYAVLIVLYLGCVCAGVLALSVLH